ncbi:spore germination protein [Virgibacillus tibetensis]
MFNRNKEQKVNNNVENFPVELFKNLNRNIDNLKKMLNEPSDLVIHEFTIGNNKCAIAYIDGLTDKDMLHNNILKNLLIFGRKQDLPTSETDLFNEVQKGLLSISSIEEGKSLDELTIKLLSGSSVFYLDGIDNVLIMATKGWDSRSIEEPQSESLIRGSREGFVENLRTNMVLIRRQIRDPNLRFKTYEVGRRSKKSLILTYVDGIIHPDILNEVNRRLATIDMDDAPESGYIEQWIEDNFLSPFPQMENTERPDKVAAAVLQGKVAIILDGTPFVLIAPITLGNMLQSPEDYYERWSIGSLLRLLRYLAAFIAMFAPSLYIALVSYHQGMIPSELAFSIAATREGVPFPAFIEAILMGITMELLREAGARLPRSIGQTVGIVGGIVIGEAAVTAGVVSPVMVIIVALTAIASFTTPSYSIAISFRMIRFGFMVAAAVLGLYGIVLVYIMINIHIVNLKSIGVPYSTPFAPGFLEDWKDLILRAPVPMLTKRPRYMQTKDKRSANKGGRSS